LLGEWNLDPIGYEVTRKRLSHAGLSLSPVGERALRCVGLRRGMRAPVDEETTNGPARSRRVDARERIELHS
jgi:hypothetical protein